ncbi:SGNH/GDSL hydrolase family protein [Curtobacterium flaccumfaciens]|uniref:SGNH/GDSL hydrolase family protein n=1 Tax=Curtobacterium flaccumfaciens TaxID=2035 RepID=UPI00112D9734|nr:SGNH/GDSL hydrolase family protein [Curtobacterium flaccumfaciens]TPG05601.1 SGNH/GDSL hydrolase family protein [Curtobacterium flaccumfaciens]
MGTNLLPSIDSDTKQLPDVVRERIADNLVDPATPEGAAVDGIFSGLLTQTRQFVYFGDSWGTQLYNGVDPLPKVTIGRLGAKLIKNYSVSGAIIGPTSQNSGNSTDAQVATAQADVSYNKSTITDVVVLAGVNNIGGYLPTVDAARDHFQAIASLFPRARLWFATNAKKAINNAGDNDPWRWYNRFFEGASLAGYAVADFSPMWTWSAIRTTGTWWDPSSSTDSSRHPSAAGFAAIAGRLAAFLTGQSWRPYFKVPTDLHSNAATLMASQGVSGTPTLSTDDTVVDGVILRLNVSIGGMDALAAVPTTAFQPILQIPTAYMPIGNYLMGPAGCRLSGGTMDFTYALRVNQDGPGVVSVDPRLLNNHVGYFVLRADLPLNTIKTAD